MSALNRAIRGAMCLLLAATLAGWGNSEADQRKAFIAFLQDINNGAIREGRDGVIFSHLLVRPDSKNETSHSVDRPNLAFHQAFTNIQILRIAFAEPSARSFGQIAALVIRSFLEDNRQAFAFFLAKD